MLSGYEKYLSFIDSFKAGKMDLPEFRAWFQPLSADIFMKLGYEKGIDYFIEAIDNWFEDIIYKYDDDKWFEFGLKIVLFYEDLIINEPRPISFPEDDPILRTWKTKP